MLCLSFYDIVIRFWNCSDGVLNIIFLYKYKKKYAYYKLSIVKHPNAVTCITRSPFFCPAIEKNSYKLNLF